MSMDIAPENELGIQGGLRPSWHFGTGKTYEVDPAETTPELFWPHNVRVFDQMRRTDGQISANLRAMTLPILSANWNLDTEGVRPEVEALVRTELGLTVGGLARRRRRREGIVWKEHLRMALLVLPYGHMPFEQVYYVGPPIPGQEDMGLEQVVHLRKLSPRLPNTLTEIRVKRDGGLSGISQTPIELSPGRYLDVFIPVDRLVFYSLDREGADWTGTSVLRASYKDWLIKEKLTRLSAQIVERNGMGVPVAFYDENQPNQTRTEMERAVQDFRGGARAGAVFPVGANFQLMGVTGTTVDPLPFIKHHDQQITKSNLAMFLDLGHDAGARSLGDTFVDFFTASLQSVADTIAETATEHVIRDLVEYNFGPDEPYPVLTPGDLASNNTVTASVLAQLTNAGLLEGDDVLEDHLRARLNLPTADKATRREKPTKGGGGVTAQEVMPLSEGVSTDDRMAALMERFMELRAMPHAGDTHV